MPSPLLRQASCLTKRSREAARLTVTRRGDVALRRAHVVLLDRFCLHANRFTSNPLASALASVSCAAVAIAELIDTQLRMGCSRVNGVR